MCMDSVEKIMGKIKLSEFCFKSGIHCLAISRIIWQFPRQVRLPPAASSGRLRACTRDDRLFGAPSGKAWESLEDISLLKGLHREVCFSL